MNHYILIDKQPVPEPDTLKWARWFGKADRTVRKDTANITLDGKPLGQIEVSTVFLGLDHNFFDNGAPVLFETMVFGGPLDQEMERCSTWEGAEKMHEKMMERVKLAAKEM